MEILQRDHYSLHAAKHGGEAKAEQHDEKEHGPQWRDGHLGNGFSKDDEGQASPLHTLRKSFNLLALQKLGPCAALGKIDGDSPGLEDFGGCILATTNCL